MNFTDQTVRSQNLDHLGLVAALCKDLDLDQRVNQLLGPSDPQRAVSAGTCVVAMILNGLGFNNRALYLSPQYFENKPLEKLFSETVQAHQLNEHALGRTLDEIADYGCTQLFANIAFPLALENGLLCDLNHIDTTSFKVHGDYKSDEDGNEHAVVEITHGYSKDHRPDLKQVVLSMVANGPAELPLWMEALDGNSSDKTSFHDSIAAVEKFRSQLDIDQPFRWVADSALYSKDKLLQSSYEWLTRVPETITQAKALVQTAAHQISWQELENGYKIHELSSNYGDCSQRWLLVFSEQAFEREKKTLDKRLDKERDKVEKALWHLSNEVFECEKDAGTALSKLLKTLKHFDIEAQVQPLTRHKKAGRPRADAQPSHIGYQVAGQVLRNEQAIQETLNAKGRFILATNNLDKERLPGAMMLSHYKSQQGVERGFRFLKDPWFMADKLFLKSPKRIEALMMIMTLSLFVYNFGQYQLREKLRIANETLPNQKNKPIQNPTLRWIFQIMDGISIVEMDLGGSESEKARVVTNITPVRQKIIQLLGGSACELYGLIAENTV